MLCDFKDVKGIMNVVIDRLDHQNLNDIDPFRELNPSAEDLARDLCREINSLVSTKNGRAHIKKAKLWETHVNAVTYFE